VRAGRLEFFPDHAKLIDRAAFKGWIKPLYDTQVARPRQATFRRARCRLAYIAPYTHRGANCRLISADEKGITFK